MKKHKKLKIFLIVLAALIAIAGVLCWWQFDNIKAVYYSWKYSNEDIDRLLEENDREVREYLDEHPEYSVRPASPVEEQLHQKGYITDEEFEEIITGQTTVEEMFGTSIELDEKKNLVKPDGTRITPEQATDMKNAASAKAQPKPETSQAPATQAAPAGGNSDAISAQVARLYVLKSAFIGRLDSLYAEAIGYYQSLPANQRKNAKSDIMKKFYSRGTALEAECDSQVASVLSEVERLLRADGSDLTLIDRIQSAYSNEKSLRKAYYLNKV